MPHVLIVEDDAPLRQTLRSLLEDEGHSVFEAPDGSPALERLQASPQRLVVLLDVQMPGMDGRQVLEAVAAHDLLATRHAYVLMTANASTLPLPFASLLTQLNVPVLAKPFDLDRLLATVAEAAQRITDAP